MKFWIGIEGPLVFWWTFYVAIWNSYLRLNLPAITNSEMEQRGFGFYINIIHVIQFGTILNQLLKKVTGYLSYPSKKSPASCPLASCPPASCPPVNCPGIRTKQYIRNTIKWRGNCRLIKWFPTYSEANTKFVGATHS